MNKENKENVTSKEQRMMEKVAAKMQLRETERQQEVEQRKIGKENKFKLNDEINSFDMTFIEMKESFTKKMEKSEEVSKENLTTHFDDLMRDLQKMQKFLGDSTVFLPAYDVRRVQLTIKQLETSLKEKQDRLQPKKKFGFKGKKKNVDVPKVQASLTTVTDSGKGLIRRDPSPAQVCGFSKRRGEKLKMDASELDGKDVTLNDLDNCEVRLFGVPSTLHITNVTDSVLLVGPVRTSVFIEGCSGCSFVMACQQLRTHAVKDSDFYLHVTSRAIIEDCSRVQFAPYNLTYDGQDRNYQQSGLDKSINNWQKVDDFNWLALNTPSPNWNILPVEMRKQFS